MGITEFPLLEAKDIEVKIKQVTAKGAVALLYKTARVDMAMLDKAVGAGSWETDYKEIGGVLYCGIGVHTDNGVRWKWSNGIESRSDGEGNQKKGEASDAFKRAGFMWGIGRELYTAPFIFLNVATEKDGTKHKLVDKYATFEVRSIEYDQNKCIASVVIENNKGAVVYPKNAKSGTTEPVAQPKNRKETVKAALKNSNLTSEDITAYMTNKGFKSFDGMPDAEFDLLLYKIEGEGA